MDFRQYDNALGRFYSPDALSELAYDQTPYRFGFNNPAFWSDPSGLFESWGAAQSWIDKWGLTGASIHYNSDKGIYEIENEGYSFYQRGQDIISSMYSLDTGITINIFKGGASAGGEVWHPGFGVGFVSTVQPGSGRITPIGGAGDLLGIKEMLVGEVTTATNNPLAGVILGAVVNKGKVSVSNAAKTVKNVIPKGFKQTKKFGYQHDQKVYEYKGKYYSKDVDAHNGGVWKVFEEVGGKLKRIGTADGNLNIFKN